MKIKDIIKDNIVRFNRLRKGTAYYTIVVEVQEEVGLVIATYEFPVPLSDIGDATLEKEDKAIMFMRYIRKAIEEGTFIKV
jgi:hypothetical protein